MADDVHAGAQDAEDPARRDFLYLTTGAFAAVGGALFVWPFINTMNASRDVIAAGVPIEVDISAVEEGQALTVIWRGEAVFIRNRTQDEVEEARAVPLDDLPDPATDESRVKPEHEAWIIVKGVCTHLGCVPLGQKPNDNRGDYGGWFCPCHGSHYDTSGRIRLGPAPANLIVPPYRFAENDILVVGEEEA